MPALFPAGKVKQGAALIHHGRLRRPVSIKQLSLLAGGAPAPSSLAGSLNNGVPSQPNQQGKPMGVSIVIVEDDETVGRILGRVLSSEGHAIGRATTAAQALPLVREKRPALAFIDLCLPDGNGIDLAHQLRAEFGDLPLILMTAYPLRVAEQPELARTFARVLIKPLDLPGVREAVAAAQRRSGVWQAEEKRPSTAMLDDLIPIPEWS